MGTETQETTKAELLARSTQATQQISAETDKIYAMFGATVDIAIKTASELADHIELGDDADVQLEDLLCDALRFVLVCWDSGVLPPETTDKIKQLAKRLSAPEYLDADFISDSSWFYSHKDDWTPLAALHCWSETAAEYKKLPGPD